MVSPLTPKTTRKVETLVRTPPTIASSREEDAALKEVTLSRYRSVNCILETKVGNTGTKVPVPRTNPNINETPTTPKSHTYPPHECDGRARDPESTDVPPTRKTETLVRVSPTIVSRLKEDAALKEVASSRYRSSNCILVVYYESLKRELKTKNYIWISV